MKSFRRFLNEGTWSLPYNDNDAKELEKLFKAPIKAKDSEHKIYHLIGDDDLFDNIDDIVKHDGADADVRYIIADKISDILNDYKKDPSRFSEKFSNESIKILNNIVKNTLKKN